MQTFNIECISVEDFSDAHQLDLDTIHDTLANSDFSYGTNDVTLISYYTVCEMFGVRPKRDFMKDDLMVALGS